MALAPLSIRETVANAFRLTTGNWRQILTIAWLPILLGTILTTWPLTRYPEEGLAGVEAADIGEALATYNTLSMIASVLSIFISAILLTGLFRFFLRGEVPARPYYLQWTGDEWRMLGTILLGGALTVATLLAFAIVAGLIFAIIYTIGVVMGQTVPFGELMTGGNVPATPFMGLMGLLMMAVTIAFLCLTLWITARVSLFYPGVIANERIDVRRFWALSENRTLQIIGAVVFGGAIAYATVILTGSLLDVTILRGAIGDYWDMLLWSPENGPQPLTLAENRMRIYTGAFASNVLSQVPLIYLLALYATLFKTCSTTETQD